MGAMASICKKDHEGEPQQDPDPGSACGSIHQQSDRGQQDEDDVTSMVTFVDSVSVSASDAEPEPQHAQAIGGVINEGDEIPPGIRKKPPVPKPRSTRKSAPSVEQGQVNKAFTDFCGPQTAPAEFSSLPIQDFAGGSNVGGGATGVPNPGHINIQNLHQLFIQAGKQPGIGTQELQKELRHKLAVKLDDWDTSIGAMILAKTGTEVCINQPIKVQKFTEGGSSQLPVSTVCQLLEDSDDGDRVFVYADAGVGKTFLLRQIAKSWVNPDSKLARRFDLVFLLPLRFVRGHSLADAICHDLGLIPSSSKDSLQQILDFDSVKTLLLLDSHEELSVDIEELNKLIRREVFSKKTVVITSRPRSQLAEMEQDVTPRLTVQLQELSEDNVKEYIQMYPHPEKGPFPAVTQAFFGMAFLQRPINLALICYLYFTSSRGVRSEMPTTQTGLFSQILHYIMQAYERKRPGGKEFPYMFGSLLTRKDIPKETRLFLKEMASMCYDALRQTQQVLLTDENSLLTKEDLLTFGLFIAGPDQNSVTLPHLLFQEYFTAVCLLSDLRAMEAVLSAMLAKSKDSSPRPCLRQAVKPLESVIKFVVGMSPRTANPLCEMFVIHQHSIFGLSEVVQSDIQYELDLFQECADHSRKSAIAEALVNAPVVLLDCRYDYGRLGRSCRETFASASSDMMVYDQIGRIGYSGHAAASVSTDSDLGYNSVRNTGSHELLRFLNDYQRKAFLEKAYGCEMYVRDDGAATLYRSNTSEKWLLCDNFVLACVDWYRCSVTMDKFHLVYSDLPVCMLTQNLIHVDEMYLYHCTLSSQLPDHMMGTMKASTQRQLTTSNTSIKYMGLWYVEGLQNLCGIALSSVQRLELWYCGVIDLALLECVFPEVDHLSLNYIRLGNTECCWPKVKTLTLDRCRNVSLELLRNVFPCLTKVELSYVKVMCAPSCEPWTSVEYLRLWESSDEWENEEMARLDLTMMCPSARINIGKFCSQPKRQLALEEWYHGTLPREETETMLNADGDFLVRESKTTSTRYVLSVMWSRHIMHITILGSDGIWWIESQAFTTIQELVEYYQTSGQRVTNLSGAVLRTPVLRGDDLELAEEIGHGNSGNIFLGRYRSTGQVVAVKTCYKPYLHQAHFHRQCDHPNIVRVLDVVTGRDPSLIVMEYIQGRDLREFIRTRGRTQTVEQLTKMCWDVAAGMAYLGSRDCIHRNLAARNCLIGADNVVKISGFSMVRVQSDHNISGSNVPVRWTAPETIEDGLHTCATDVWSFGILMWEVFSFGAIPYPGLSNIETVKQISTGYRMSAPENMPPPVQKLMEHCWAREPMDRPHFLEICAKLREILGQAVPNRPPREPQQQK